jgi:hypothetical protein
MFAQPNTPVLCGSLSTSWCEIWLVILLLDIYPWMKIGRVLYYDLEAVGKDQRKLNLGWIVGRFN